MQIQADLFGIATDTDPRRVFPQFEIERPNCDYSGKLKLSEMPVVLAKLGFRVSQMKHHTSTVLVFPVGECEESTTLFEVSYPEGWTLTEDVMSTIYYCNDNPIRQIIDSRGHLRGVVHCGYDKLRLPLSAELYTRYSVWNGVPLNFAKVGFDRDGVRSVVVDRTKIDPQQPSTLDTVEHIDRRWLLAEQYPELKDIPPAKRSAWVSEHVPTRSIAIGISGSSLWLDEHFPDWHNPAAYWP